MKVTCGPDTMPWGKFRGWTIETIPADYLIFVLNFDDLSVDVREMIEAHTNTVDFELKVQSLQKQRMQQRRGGRRKKN